MFSFFALSRTSIIYQNHGGASFASPCKYRHVLPVYQWAKFIRIFQLLKANPCYVKILTNYSTTISWMDGNFTGLLRF